MGNVPLQPCCVMRDHDESALDRMPKFPPCSAPLSPRAKARSKSVCSTPNANGKLIPAAGQTSNAKRHSKTRSPKGVRSPEETRSKPLPIATITKKGRSAAVLASAAERGGERSRRAREEKHSPTPTTSAFPPPAAAENEDALEESPPASPPLEQQEVVPVKAALLTLAPSLKGAEAQEKQEVAKEHKEKRKKRKEASKGDFSDRTSEDGSTRSPCLGAQVTARGPGLGPAAKGERACAARALADGTETMTTETCGTLTSEGGLLSCGQAFGIAWEPAAEEPCGSDGTETLTEQAWFCRPEEPELSKEDEPIPSTTPDEGCPTQSKVAPMPSVPNDVGEQPTENGSIPTDLGALATASPAGDGHSPVIFDLAAADGEMPALAPEFTAQLDQVDLGNFAEPLARLGVEATRDIAYISDKELGRIGMRLVQRRKLRAMVSDGQEEGDEIYQEETKLHLGSATDDGSGCCSEVSTEDCDRVSDEGNPTKLEAVA